jgi:hypothetical protein
MPGIAPHTRREGGRAEQNRFFTSPLKLPLDSARHAPRTGVDYNDHFENAE